ncbi:MAG TPA: hypothetical protein VKU02_27350 [Gemmataceae bacterium]|nr:hypothetical protein [Gemmataceae bacterium]
MRRTVGMSLMAVATAAGLLLGGVRMLRGESPQPRQALNPAAWGSDHVGKPVPEYVTGDECLFCHRADVGPAWTKNRHQRTVREAETDSAPLAALKNELSLQPFAGEVKLLLGGKRQVRYLKPAKGYGKLELLSVAWTPGTPTQASKLLSLDQPHWDPQKFNDACAGCHATGVDSKNRTFSSLSLDCYVCHGDASLAHSKDPSLMLLAKQRRDPARMVISVCAQCHARTGHSGSTGLPFSNNFVAGDNLFRDFQVDWSPARIAALNPADRHVLENVRAVVLGGKEDVTCLTCHDVHKQSSLKHHRVAPGEICLNCHDSTGSKKVRKSYEVHSATCGY